MKFDHLKRTILVTMAGSRAYGTSGPTSDIDIKGVFIAPASYRNGFMHSIEQIDKPEGLACYTHLLNEDLQQLVNDTKLDGAIYEIRKFFKLAAACNPNILDALFCDSSDRLLCTNAGQLLIDNKDKFISLKAFFTFRGYARAQIDRIKTHRKWLLNPLECAPSRSDFLLAGEIFIPQNQLTAALSMITKKIDSWEIDFGDMDEATKIYIIEQLKKTYVEISVGSKEKFFAAGRLIGFNENFIELLDREHQYRAARDNWSRYNEWKTGRNAQRASLEAKFGFDTKHALHLCRLLTMCREILETGNVIVKRPDAEFLLSIKAGAWNYDALLAWSHEQDEKLLQLLKVTMLPKTPDYSFLNSLCCQITEQVCDV